MEREPRDSAKRFIHVQYFFRHRLRGADQERAGRSAHGVELCPGRPRPAPFLADLGEGVRVPGAEIIRGLLSGVSKEADRVQTHKRMGFESIGGREVPLVDRVHRLMHLWRDGDARKLSRQRRCEAFYSDGKRQD